MTELSYHALHITTETLARTSITALPFNVMVMCTRSGGWEVWHRPGERGEPAQFAGEFSAEGLRLDVGGHVIVDSLTNPSDDSDEAVARALALHLFAHKVDRAGEPYINHVTRVAEGCREFGAEVVVVAWLHDVVEDCDMSLDTLRETFPATICDAVDALTRRNGEDYLNEYIPRLRTNKLARYVKCRDLQDNMNLARLPTITRADIDRWLKYEAAFNMVRHTHTQDIAM